MVTVIRRLDNCDDSECGSVVSGYAIRRLFVAAMREGCYTHRAHTCSDSKARSHSPKSKPHPSVRKFVRQQLRSDLNDVHLNQRRHYKSNSNSNGNGRSSTTKDGVLPCWVALDIENQHESESIIENQNRNVISSTSSSANTVSRKRRLVGFVSLSRCGSYRREQVEVKHLCVDPSRRRQGIGRALMDHAIAFCENADRGFVAMTLETLRRLHSAVRFYTNTGFTLVGERMIEGKNSQTQGNKNGGGKQDFLGYRDSLGLGNINAPINAEKEMDTNNNITLLRFRRVLPAYVTSLPTYLPTYLPASKSLSALDKMAFLRDGYLCVRQSVSTALCDRALRLVNASLGQPGQLVSGGVEGSVKLAGGASSSAAIMALFRGEESAAVSLCECLLGRGKVAMPQGAQIALRFPIMSGSNLDLDLVSPLRGTEWHTDGMRQGRKHPFTLLLGVCLSDCAVDPFCGNFTVFKGSHAHMHRLLLPGGRVRGCAGDASRAFSVAVGGGDHQNPWCSGQGLPDFRSPTQLCLRKGDVVLAHSALAHRGGPNHSPHVRYMVYFRVKHVALDTPDMQARLCTDSGPLSLWADYEGIQTVAIALAESIKCSDLLHHHRILNVTEKSTSISGSNSILLSAGCVNGRFLTAAQIFAFKRDGVLVVPGILSEQEVLTARAGFHATLARRGVIYADLERTADMLTHLSSTGGAGGVLDLFYPDWKLRATLGNEYMYRAITDLYAATYGSYHKHEKGKKNDYKNEENTHVQTDVNTDSERELWAHPYEDFDPRDAFAHIDRVGFRLPDAINTKARMKRRYPPTYSCTHQPTHQTLSPTAISTSLLPTDLPTATSKCADNGTSKRRERGLQRSLTPHLDCCPDKMYAGGGKAFPRWRPIQCMLALTPTMEADCGGFECAPGFHREFKEYFDQHRDEKDSNANLQATNPSTTSRESRPCVGDFSPIRSKEDAAVFSRILHIPIPAGAAVFWDQRIAHANSRRNRNKHVPREVIYGGYLPRTRLNAVYAKEQLRRLRCRLPQPDFWIDAEKSETGEQEEGDGTGSSREIEESLSPLGRHLLGL